MEVLKLIFMFMLGGIYGVCVMKVVNIGKENDNEKNKMADVAALLDVELGEVFTVKDKGEWLIDDEGLKRAEGKDDNRSSKLLTALLTGEAETIKKPWKPEVGEWYYCIDDDAIADGIEKYIWEDRIIDYCYAIAGNVFRTAIEAEIHKGEIMEKFNEWMN